MHSGESCTVPLSIALQMLRVGLRETLHALVNLLDTTRFTNCLCAEVRVATRAVQVLTGFGVIGDSHIILFGNSLEQKTRQIHVVARLDTDTRANLELPLVRCNLGIDSRELDTRCQADSQMFLGNFSLNIRQ